MLVLIGHLSNLLNKTIRQQYKTFTSYYKLADPELWQHEIKTNFNFLNFLGADIDKQDDIWPEFWYNKQEIEKILEAQAVSEKQGETQQSDHQFHNRIED